MARSRTVNPAKVKATMTALEAHPPAEVFRRRIELRRPLSLVLLSLLTVVLLSASFAPSNCWYLAYVALVPWTLALTSRRGALLTVGLAAGAGTLFWAANLYWLWWITLVGYVPLVLYLSAYWLVAAWIVRRALARGLPMWLVLPVTWVVLEFARSRVISGFPWFFLAHTQYAQSRLIQVADLTGQYGVSFFVALVNGAVVDLLYSPLFSRSATGARLNRQMLAGAAATIGALAALLTYGTWRLAQTTRRPGPVVGIVQQAFPISLHEQGEPEDRVLQAHVEGSEPLVGKGCDLVIWPETMLPSGLNPEWLAVAEQARDPRFRKLLRYADEVGGLCRRLGCDLLAGGMAIRPNPLPTGAGDEILLSNSALRFGGSPRALQQYDKMHLVPFSEYVPFKHSARWLHEALRALVPAVMVQLEPGPAPTCFEVRRDRNTWQVVTPICYEGTFARVCRGMVYRDGRKKADLLANLSNDGWFVWQWQPWKGQASSEQDQHMVQYCFRAIENRVPVVRAVNTGISASIDSNGRITRLLTLYGKSKMIAGTMLLSGGRASPAESLVCGPRVLVDSRTTIYGRVGDLFAWLVGAGAAAGLVWLAWKRPAKERGQQ